MAEHEREEVCVPLPQPLFPLRAILREVRDITPSLIVRSQVLPYWLSSPSSGCGGPLLCARTVLSGGRSGTLSVGGGGTAEPLGEVEVGLLSTWVRWRWDC